MFKIESLVQHSACCSYWTDDIGQGADENSFATETEALAAIKELQQVGFPEEELRVVPVGN